MLRYVEKFFCPNPACDNREIPSTRIVIDWPLNNRPADRLVHAHCECCNRLYANEQTSSGGFWRGSALVVVETDKRTVERVMRTIDQQEGTLQMSA